jgi:hypothetical protein
MTKRDQRLDESSMKTRAELFSGQDQPMRVEKIDIEPPHADDVLVHMVAAGVCGSDLHVVRGEWNRPTPMAGHEGAASSRQSEPCRPRCRRRCRDAVVGTVLPGVRVLLADARRPAASFARRSAPEPWSTGRPAFPRTAPASIA